MRGAVLNHKDILARSPKLVTTTRSLRAKVRGACSSVHTREAPLIEIRFTKSFAYVRSDIMDLPVGRDDAITYKFVDQ